MIKTMFYINCHQDVCEGQRLQLRVVAKSSTLYWQLGAVWSWRKTSEVLSGRLVWSIPEISVAEGTLVNRPHQVITETVNRSCKSTRKRNNSRETITNLTVVKESSLNHGTIILYTLGNRSADRNTVIISNFSMCTCVCLCIYKKQTYLYVLCTGLQH